MHIVIRAGGIGTRLWPLSRTHKPKQFQSLVGERTMIQSTYDRITDMVISEDDIFVSVNDEHVQTLRKELPKLSVSNVIAEPETRNTGPAMCLEVAFLASRLNMESVIASIPSDDYVGDAEAFKQLLLISERFIKENPDYILTPAVSAAVPDTGYSYFRSGKELMKHGEESIVLIEDVVEKPNKDYLHELLETGKYFAHTGMYIWKLGRVVELFKEHQPKMYETCEKIVKAKSENDVGQVRELYSTLERMSIEAALTDKVESLAMSISNRIEWSDLGKWHVLKRVLASSEDEVVTRGDVVNRESSNSIVYSTVNKKIIVINNVKDICVVDTEDALFVSSLDDSDHIKEILEELKKKGKDMYL